MFELEKFTVLQLLLAAGISRHMDRQRMTVILHCSNPYVTKCMKDKNFILLVNLFRLQSKDSEIEEQSDDGNKLRMMVGKLLYNYNPAKQ